MFFKPSRIFVIFSLIFLIGFSVILSKKADEKSNTTLGEKQTSSIDSIAQKAQSLTHFDHQQDSELGSKVSKESHSSLNSVNLIIYMIYKVTNKSF